MPGDADPQRRQAGVCAIGHAIRPEAIDAADVEMLAGAACDPDGELRATALGALSSLKSDDRVVAVMLAAVHDPYPGVRVSALAGLGYSGRVAAVPAIVELATDPDARVRVVKPGRELPQRHDEPSSMELATSGVSAGVFSSHEHDSAGCRR